MIPKQGTGSTASLSAQHTGCWELTKQVPGGQALSAPFQQSAPLPTGILSADLSDGAALESATAVHPLGQFTLPPKGSQAGSEVSVASRKETVKPGDAVLRALAELRAAKTREQQVQAGTITNSLWCHLQCNLSRKNLIPLD